MKLFAIAGALLLCAMIGRNARPMRGMRVRELDNGQVLWIG